MHLVFVPSSVKDISCSGSHCAVQKVNFKVISDVSTGTVFFPSHPEELFTLALSWQAHMKVSGVHCVRFARA